MKYGISIKKTSPRPISTSSKKEKIALNCDHGMSSDTQGGSVNRLGPHKLIESGTIKRYALVGVSVVLLEEAGFRP